MQDHRPLPPASWRLWLYERVSDRAHVSRCASRTYLWRHQRDHEGTDRADSLTIQTIEPSLPDLLAMSDIFRWNRCACRDLLRRCARNTGQLQASGLQDLPSLP